MKEGRMDEHFRKKGARERKEEGRERKKEGRERKKKKEREYGGKGRKKLRGEGKRAGMWTETHFRMNRGRE